MLHSLPLSIQLFCNSFCDPSGQWFWLRVSCCFSCSSRLMYRLEVASIWFNLQVLSRKKQKRLKESNVNQIYINLYEFLGGKNTKHINTLKRNPWSAQEAYVQVLIACEMWRGDQHHRWWYSLIAYQPSTCLPDFLTINTMMLHVHVGELGNVGRMSWYSRNPG